MLGFYLHRMKKIDRTDLQVVFDAFAMSKIEFVEIYEIVHVQRGQKATTQELSSLWHDIRRRETKSDTITRKTQLSDLEESWSKPGSAASSERLPDGTRDVSPSPKTIAKVNSKTVPKTVKKKSDESNISRADQIAALMEKGITSAKEIAESIGAHPSYVSALLKKMKNAK